jgi:hypothetical protein
VYRFPPVVLLSGIGPSAKSQLEPKPGIAKRHLPAGLQADLPPTPNGYESIVVDGKILLVKIATQSVRGVLTDIVIG